MFNLGLWELFILAAVALIVVGPEKLPKLARDVARFLNDVKRTTGSFTNEMNKVMDEENFQQDKIEDQAPEDPLAELRNGAEEKEKEEKTDV